MPAARVSVTCTPILGPSGPSAQPLATLLCVEDTRILLDCGWTESFQEATLAPLQAIVSALDAVLLSSSSLECAGGIPYLYTKLGCTAPCYMTLPVHRLAPLTLLDAFAGKLSDDPSFSSFTVEDVASSFTLKEFGGHAVQVRFGEDAMVKGVALLAVNAGHTLGACAWRLQRSAESIVYAPTFNHRSEAHLSKATMAAHFRAPSAFITLSTPGSDLAQAMLEPLPSAATLPGALGLGGPGTGLLAGLTAAAAAATASANAAAAAAAAAAPAKESTNVNKELGEACLATLRAGGNVLLPMDTAGRSLEVLLRLEAALAPDALRGVPGAPPGEPRDGYPIFLLSHVSSSVVEHAKTLLEFMNERLGKEFAETRTTPFSFEGREHHVHDKAPVKIVQSLEPIIACVAGGHPCVVLASGPTLDMGLSRALLQQWVTNPKNSVIFTNKSAAPAGTLASQLMSSPPPSAVSYEHMLTVPLTGPELRKWREAKDEEKRRVARAAAAARARAEERAELAETVVLPVLPAASPVAGSATPSASASTGVRTSSGVSSSSGGVAVEAQAQAQGQGSSGMPAGTAVGTSAAYRVDADGYTLDEDLIAQCEYVDEVAESAMAGSGAHVTGSSVGLGVPPGAAGAGAAGAGVGAGKAGKAAAEATRERMDDEDDEAPPGAEDERAPGEEDGPPGMNPSLFPLPRTAGVGGTSLGKKRSAEQMEGGGAAEGEQHKAKYRRVRRAAGPEGVLVRAPASLRFAMFGRDLGADARATFSEYGWSYDPAWFPQATADGGQAGAGAGDSTGLSRPGVSAGAQPGSSPTSAAPSSALAALQRLLPTAGNGTLGTTAAGPGSASGPLASAVLASAVAATGLVKPGEVVPTKRVKNVVSLRVAARILHIGLEGRVDGHSLVNVLEEVRPRSVVLLRGPTAAAQTALASALRKVASHGVHTPSLGLPVDVSSGVAEVSLLIRDALWSTLHFAKLALPTVPGIGLGGAAGQGAALEVAYVHAAVESTGPGTPPVLTLAAGAPPGHLPVLLRAGAAARLADVRKRLAKAGIEADAAGEGAIMTKGGILITRATGAGKSATADVDSGAEPQEVEAGQGAARGPLFEVEGPACQEYFQESVSDSGEVREKYVLKWQYIRS